MFMRRWLCVLLTMLLCVFYGGTALAEQILVVANPDPEDRLHLRVSTSTTSASLGKYYNGTQVVVLKTYANGWAKVQIGPLDGYMMTQYLSDEKQASALAEGAWQGTTLYALPDIQSNSQQLNGYEKLCIMGFRDEWCHVYVPALDCTGFVHASVDALAETNAVVQSRAWVYNPDSADRLNLRQHPSTDAASLGKYYNGVPVDVLELAQNGWVKVRICEAATGYMQAKYLSAYKVATAFPLVYTTHPQQLRLEPRSSGKAIEPIQAGTGTTVLGVCGPWYHVLDENLDGYIQAAYTDTQLKR